MIPSSPWTRCTSRNLPRLLRTLAKEHRRQVIIAVHDRPVYDYLSLELSPAFAGDELITIELAKSAEDHTRFAPRRRAFEPDTAVKPIAVRHGRGPSWLAAIVRSTT